MIRKTTAQLRHLAADWRARLVSIASLAAVSTLPALLIVRQLRAAGALTPATARPFRPQSATEAFEFGRLLRAGIIRGASSGRYFLA